MFRIASPLPHPFKFTAVESWKVVPTHPTYSASTLGRIRDDLTGRILRPAVASHGYRQVRVRVEEGRRSETVHALVAAAFHGPCPDGLEVDHVNGDVRDNRPTNLGYCSHAENMRRAAARGQLSRGEKHYAAKLSDDLVRRLRGPLARGELTRVAREAGCSVSACWRARKGLSWRSA